jgi:predicted metalloenzyme YecM/phosphoglycolate phosphatase-like HAD superfamily hydrolase
MVAKPGSANSPDPQLDLKAIPGFVEKLLFELHELGLTAHIAAIDHVCYRVSSEEHYESELHHLLRRSDMISETLVNDRPISVVQLHKPFEVEGLTVEVVELPAPKTGRSYKDGWEHMEVVCRTPIEEISKQFARVNFDRSALAHPFAPELTLRLKSGLVKFHNKSLLQVIAGENQCYQERQPAWNVILDLDDTLVFSRDAFLKAVQAAIQDKLGKQLTFAEVKEKSASTFERFFGNFGIITADDIADTVKLFQEKYARVADEVTLPYGIRNFMSVLYHSGINIHVWTARDEKTASATLRQFGLMQYVKRLHAWTPAGPNKPRPNDALKELVANGRCIVLGDSDSDISGSISLGAPFIQSIWIHQKKLPLGDYPRASTPRIALHEIFRILTKASKSAGAPVAMMA